MQYNVEDLSPVRKKISLTVPFKEVNAAIDEVATKYRNSAAFDGFRKGKAPLSLIEKRFKEAIYDEAASNLLNSNVSNIITEIKVVPVSRFEFDGDTIVRDKDLSCSFTFDIMPEFELPIYENFELEQDKVVVEDSEVDEVIERLRNNFAEESDLDEKREAKSGEVAVIDFSSFDEDNNEIKNLSGKGFKMVIGQEETIPDFEKLICSVKNGESGEGKVTFPSDFFNPEFAGKTVTMKVSVTGLKVRALPELNDEFAKKAGNVESLEVLKNNIKDSYQKNREEINKSLAQNDLLDKLLEKKDFPLPESLVNANLDSLVEDYAERLRQQGKQLSDVNKTLEELREELLPDAKKRTKSYIFLVTVAKKKELSVSEQEMDTQLRVISYQTGQPYETIKNYYIENNLLYALRDKILTDKALNILYEAAKITYVEPKAKDSEDKK